MESLYDCNEIRDYEIKIFASGNCKCFVPMSFMKTNQKLCVIYHTEGYQKLDLSQFQDPYEILNLVEKMVLCVKEAQNHLILHTRYYLTENYIYLDQDMSVMKIIFIPSKENEEKPNFSEKMVHFLEEMKFENVRCSEYINLVIHKLEKFNLSMGALLNYLSELKREIHLCGWE